MGNVVGQAEVGQIREGLAGYWEDSGSPQEAARRWGVGGGTWETLNLEGTRSHLHFSPSSCPAPPPGYWDSAQNYSNIELTS